jgi:hypothetical protein
MTGGPPRYPTAKVRPTGYAGDVIRVVEDLAAQGADTVYFHVYGPSDAVHIELLGEQVVSRF